jgi:hypothetical protein
MRWIILGAIRLYKTYRSIIMLLNYCRDGDDCSLGRGSLHLRHRGVFSGFNRRQIRSWGIFYSISTRELYRWEFPTLWYLEFVHCQRLYICTGTSETLGFPGASALEGLLPIVIKKKQVLVGPVPRIDSVDRSEWWSWYLVIFWCIWVKQLGEAWRKRKIYTSKVLIEWITSKLSLTVHHLTVNLEAM